MADLSKIFPGGFKAAIHTTHLVDPIPAFQTFCAAHGLMATEVIADGEIHRVPCASSKRGALDGWYILFTDGKFPVGVCGDWREPDASHEWRAEMGRAMTFQETIEHRAWVEQVKIKKAAEREAKHEAAAERAEEEVAVYADASDEHPYLVRKRVKAHGIKVDRAGRLVVPIINAKGEIVSHQTIDSDGTKRYLKGGKKAGGYYEIRGNRQVVFVGEGFATCASVNEATGCTCLVAFDAGNLTEVAKIAKEHYLGAKIVLAADNDQFTDANPGLKAANDAANAVKGLLVAPTFSEEEIRAGKPTDFNDLHVLRGLDAVREQIERITAPVQERQAFPFTRVGDLELKNIEWLVEDYIEADSLIQIYGEPGSGKSFVAIDIACCIATGTPWHGHAVRQGAIFYIAGEGHNGLARRFKAWEIAYGVSLKEAPIFKSHRAAQLYDISEAALVGQTIREMVEIHQVIPAMVVIDTLARNMGGDENSTKDMNEFVANIDTYLRRTYRASVMAAHHSGVATKERARGSSVMRGAIDAEYRIELNQTSKAITFTPTKMKDAELPPPLTFGLAQVPLPILDKHGNPAMGAYLTQVDISGIVPQAAKPVRRGLTDADKSFISALDILQASIDRTGNRRAITDAEWRDAVKAGGGSTRNPSRVMEKLVEYGMVKKVGSGYRMITLDEPDGDQEDGQEGAL